MNRAGLYAVIGILAVLVAVLGLYFVNSQTRKPALEIHLNDQGLTVDGNT